jgi:diguanylate cyclase
VALDSVDLSVEISAGVVVSGEHGDDAATLLQRAEVAMYAAKQQGRGLSVYEPSDDVHDAERLALLADLRRAIDNRDLELHYQPKVALATGAVCGVEALVRWRHPQRGMIPPVTFIPLAEHTALIGPLTEHVLDTALAQAHTWAEAGHAMPVSVNLSARNLTDPNLFETVVRALSRHGVPAQMLTLELTESAIITEPEGAHRVLSGLRAVGVGLAIDDFGAGYTSLGQLKELPVTELKIDRSFVSAMATDPSAAMIVRSIIELATNLGLSTTAEGVEDAATLEALRLDGCETAQGYHMARPMPADDFDAWRADRPMADRAPGRRSVERPERRTPAPSPSI